METSRENISSEEFVTIVSVGNGETETASRKLSSDSRSDVPFVTVLSIGQRESEQEVIVYRLPGEKLGFGLKFEGGTKSAERVRRLFIQSCATESPAGRARAAWGPLVAGDEILRIDRLPVTALTRLECVRCLTDSNVAVTLLVRHSTEEGEDLQTGAAAGGIDKDRSALPPPVPPRKIPRRNTKEVPTSDARNSVLIDSNQTAIDIRESKKLDLVSKNDSITDSNGHVRKGKQSPGRPRRLAPGHTPPPPEAQVYTDLFYREKENGIHVAESESDDTGSSISTVIDRLSAYSSFPGSVENSIPSTPTLGLKHMNVQNVLTCIENMNEKFISDIPPGIIEEKIRAGISNSTPNTPPVTKKSNPGDRSYSKISNGYSNVHLINEGEAAENVSSSEITINNQRSSTTLWESANVTNKNIASDANNNMNLNKSSAKAEPIGIDVTDCVMKEPVSAIEPPKPLPRNLNKKNIDTLSSKSDYPLAERPYEDNLSATKLHCIESWLQDSIGCKVEPRDEREADGEIPLLRPEALPRLIDFVPKMQFAGNANPKTGSCEIVAETAHDKPPQSAGVRHVEPEVVKPPAVDKEHNLQIVITKDMTQDWFYSGGSPQLEPIGEDDEYSSACPTLLSDELTRHPPAGDSGSDRDAKKSPILTSREPSIELTPPQKPIVVVQKEKSPKTSPVLTKKKDNEDNAIVTVTRGPRPPPDGRENPSAHQEDTVPVNIQYHTSQDKYTSQKYKTQITVQTKEMHENKQVIMNPRMVRCTSYESPIRNGKATSKAYGLRGKDAKSEGSVKDKIAMFSVNKTAADPVCAEKKVFATNRTSEPRPRSVSTLTRPTHLRTDYISKSHENLLDFSPNSPIEKHSKTQNNSLDWNINSAPPVPTSIPSYIETFALAPPKPPIDDDESELTFLRTNEVKVSPVVLLNRKLADVSSAKASDTTGNQNHRSTIDYLIEQRRKSMTKLRGLVIPESPCVFNLPEIKSRDSLKMFTSPVSSEVLHSSSNIVKPVTSVPSPWDSQSIINNVPKYSPAFKRKSLQVYGPQTSTTLMTSTLPKYKSAWDSDSNMKKENLPMMSQELHKKHSVPSKPPRTSLDTKRSCDQLDISQKVQTLPSSFRASTGTGVVNHNLLAQSSKARYHDPFFGYDILDNSSRLSKIYNETADSDNDSAVSSSRSDYLSTVSSPTPSLHTESDCSSQSILSQDVTLNSKYNGVKLFPKNDEGFNLENDFNGSMLLSDEKRNVCRSLSSDTSASAGSSNSSTLTSGSQASCSSAGSSNTDTGHRVLKPRSVEAINRKNILASAKCRSGKDNKFGSPLIERKFSDDSTVESTDEFETKNTPYALKEPHRINGVEKPKFVARNRASRVEERLADSILKVAYTTVIEDICIPKNNEDTDSTYSDTGSDSDIGVVNKPKKYTNGNTSVERIRSQDIAFVRRSSDSHTKPPVERAKVKPTPQRATENITSTVSATINNNIEITRIVKRASEETLSVDISKSSEKNKKEYIKMDSCESKVEDEDWFSVRLMKGEASGVGVTLAGGADCEAKEVTIHKVLQGSAAQRDGRLCKGDKVLSINGHSMRGVTHAESVAILKDPQPEVTLIIHGKCPSKDIPTKEVSSHEKQTDNTSNSSEVISVELLKADTPGGAGLGISLEGGGNKPLLINKLFTGGAAARSGRIVSGSELLAAGDAKLSGLTRTEAWGLLRGLPAGPVTLILRPP